MIEYWTTYHAVLFCTSSSIIYVSSLYIIVPSKVRLYPRDHPLQIQYRLMAVSVATIFCLCLYVLVLPFQKYLHVNAWQSLGFYNLYHNTSERSSPNEYISSIFTTILLMLIFYLGPVITSMHYAAICCYYHVNYDGSTKLLADKQSHYVLGKFLKNIYVINRNQFTTQSIWMIIRALLVAPITEEIMFRSVMVPSLYMAFLSVPSTVNHSSSMSHPHVHMLDTATTHSHQIYDTPWVIVWMNPLFFGCAHIHHFYEKLLNRVELKSAILSTLIQFIYTSIFGFIATLLFMRTGLVLFAWLILPLTEQYAVTSIYWKSYV